MTQTMTLSFSQTDIPGDDKIKKSRSYFDPIHGSV